MFICSSSYSGLSHSMQEGFQGSNYQMISRILFVGVILSLMFYNVYVAYCFYTKGEFKEFCTEAPEVAVMFFLSFVFGLLSMVVIIMKPDNVFNVIENVVSIACWILLILIIVKLKQNKGTPLKDILSEQPYFAIVFLLIQYSIYSMYYGIFQDKIYSQDPNIHNENYVIFPCIVIVCGLIVMVISNILRCYCVNDAQFEISLIDQKSWLKIVVFSFVFIVVGFCVVLFGVKLADVVALFLICLMNIIVELIKSLRTIYGIDKGYKIYKAEDRGQVILDIMRSYLSVHDTFYLSNVLMMSMWMIFGVWYGSISYNRYLDIFV